MAPKWVGQTVAANELTIRPADMAACEDGAQ